MTWRIEFLPEAEKDLAKLDRAVARRILRILRDRIAPLDDARALGDPLRGPLATYWKYRIGDHRVVCRIEDSRITVIVVRVGHRREVYR